MFRTLLKKSMIPLMLAGSVAAADASVMTFDNLTDPLASVYVEDGITATGNGDLGIYTPGAVHMDDFGTSSPSLVTFTMASRFDALSFDLSPTAFHLDVYLDSGEVFSPTYQNVAVRGYRGGAVVSSLLFDMSFLTSPTVTLGSAFTNLSALTIEVLFPYQELVARYGPDVANFCAPCSHFDIDNVTLAPVPLPPGLPLAASALAGLGLLSRRKRRAPAG